METREEMELKEEELRQEMIRYVNNISNKESFLKIANFLYPDVYNIDYSSAHTDENIIIITL